MEWYMIGWIMVDLQNGWMYQKEERGYKCTWEGGVILHTKKPL